MDLSIARRQDAIRKKRKRNGEKREKTKRHEHNVQERTRSKDSLSTVDIYAKRVLRPFSQNPATHRKVVLTLSLYVSYLLLLSISLLTLLMSIIFPSCKVIEEIVTTLITLLFRVFTLLPPSLTPAYIIET